MPRSCRAASWLLTLILIAPSNACKHTVHLLYDTIYMLPPSMGYEEGSTQKRRERHMGSREWETESATRKCENRIVSQSSRVMVRKRGKGECEAEMLSSPCMCVYVNVCGCLREFRECASRMALRKIIEDIIKKTYWEDTTCPTLWGYIVRDVSQWFVMLLTPGCITAGNLGRCRGLMKWRTPLLWWILVRLLFISLGVCLRNVWCATCNETTLFIEWKNAVVARVAAVFFMIHF